MLSFLVSFLFSCSTLSLLALPLWVCLSLPFINLYLKVNALGGTQGLGTWCSQQTNKHKKDKILVHVQKPTSGQFTNPLCILGAMILMLEFNSLGPELQEFHKHSQCIARKESKSLTSFRRPLSLGGVRFDGVSFGFICSGATNAILYFLACLSCTDHGEFLEGPEDADSLTKALSNAREKGTFLRLRLSADSLDVPILLLSSSNHATSYWWDPSFSSSRIFKIRHIHGEASRTPTTTSPTTNLSLKFL